jgi:hypothetical protein
MLEKRELGLPAKFGPSRVLVKELAEMESWMGGQAGGNLSESLWRQKVAPRTKPIRQSAAGI